MEITYLGLICLIILGFTTAALQFIFYKEDLVTESLLVLDKTKQEAKLEEYNPETVRGRMNVNYSPSAYWVTLKANDTVIEFNDEELFNKSPKGETITIVYKKSYWKLGKKKIIIGYQLLRIIDK